MKKPATKRNADAQIRVLYGWTKESIPIYPGISPSHVSLHEMDEWLLPAEVLRKCLEWVVFTHVEGTGKSESRFTAAATPDFIHYLKMREEAFKHREVLLLLGEEQDWM